MKNFIGLFQHVFILFQLLLLILKHSKMDKEKKDFKSVKVNIKSGTKNVDTLSRSMLYSGINIFGQLSQVYLQNKQEMMSDASAAAAVTSEAKALAGSSGSDMMALPPDVLLIFKRMQKKDPITKCKAFKELDDFLLNLEKYSEEHANLLTFFLYHYCRILINEQDRKVREAAQTTLGSFIAKGVKRLGPHMSKIFPVWFCSFYDSAPEVAALARKNFEDAFKSNGERVFKISFQYFLHFADEHIRQSEEQLSEGAADSSKKAKEDTFDRVISSILMALADSFEFTKDWADEDRAYYVKKMISYLDLKKEPLPLKDGQKTVKYNETKLWLFLGKKNRSRVRAACLTFISKFLLNVPREIGELHASEVAPAIFDMISEDNSVVQGTLWKEALFTLGRQFPEVWSLVALKKSFIPGMLACVKNSAFGAANALYPNLVKFVSVFPLFHFQDIQEDKLNKFNLKDRAKFLVQFYQHLFAGLKNDEASSYHSELIGAYFESLMFFILKRFQPYFLTKDTDYDFALAQLRIVIELPVTDFIIKYEKSTSKALKSRNSRSSIPSHLIFMFKNLKERSLLDEKLFDMLLDVVYETIVSRIAETNAVKLAKAFIKQRGVFVNEQDYLSSVNQKMNVRIINQIFNSELMVEIKDVNRKTLDDTLKKASNLQNLVICMSKHQLGDSCFEAVSLLSVLDLLKGLDTTEIRAAKMLDTKDLDKLNQLKQCLVVVSLASLNRASQSNSDEVGQFLSYVLIESKQINPELQKMILLPPQEAPEYFNKIRSNSEIIFEHVSKLINERISSSWEIVNKVFSLAEKEKTSHFVNEAQPNTLARLILEQLDKSQSVETSSSLLKGVSHILVQTSKSSIFENDLIVSLQTHLSRQIMSIESLSKSGLQHYQSLWILFKQIVENQQSESLIGICQQHLKQTMAQLIAQINSQTKEVVSLAAIQKVDKLTKLIKDFVKLIPAEKRSTIVNVILLHSENFQQVSKNCLPLKIFKDIYLQGGISFDIQSLFSATNGLEYAWLAFILINLGNISSLNNLPVLKKQLTVFSETEVIPAIIIATQKDNKGLATQLIKLFKNEIEATGDQCLSTLDSFLSKIVNPGEEFGFDEPLLKTDDFKEMFSVLCRDKAQQLIDKHFESVAAIDVRVMSLFFKQASYFVLDEPEVQSLIKLAKKTLHIDVLTKHKSMREVAYSISIYLALYSHFVKDFDAELQETTVQWILQNFLQEWVEKGDQQQMTFNLSVILEFLANMMDLFGMNKFNQVISKMPDDTLMKWEQDKPKQLKDQIVSLKATIAEKKAAAANQENAPAPDVSNELEQIEHNEATLKRMEEQASLETLIHVVINISQEGSVKLDAVTYMNLMTLIRKVIPNDKIIKERHILIDDIIELAKNGSVIQEI